MDKNQILDQLKQINYPGFNRDIVSFGMVKDVVIDQTTKVTRLNFEVIHKNQGVIFMIFNEQVFK